MGDFCRACGKTGTSLSQLCIACVSTEHALNLRFCPTCGGDEWVTPPAERTRCARCPDPERVRQEANLRAHLESMQRLTAFGHGEPT